MGAKEMLAWDSRHMVVQGCDAGSSSASELHHVKLLRPHLHPPPCGTGATGNTGKIRVGRSV